uniref:Uncharacterized protein n=1 Tax=Picea glauca TaxID=3330 RepID=A0A101LYJ8_PICGL|nr:hypothetical protein ABT39_MTgene5872 [Picea glauca]QHR92103.1 hypothetical protein Q903MT_gene6139 [Picea sitchensis]
MDRKTRGGRESAFPVPSQTKPDIPLVSGPTITHLAWGSWFPSHLPSMAYPPNAQELYRCIAQAYNLPLAQDAYLHITHPGCVLR